MGLRRLVNRGRVLRPNGCGEKQSGTACDRAEGVGEVAFLAAHSVLLYCDGV